MMGARLWLAGVKALVVIGLVAWLFASGGIPFRQVLGTVTSARWWSIAVPLGLGSILLVNVRWWMLLRAEGIPMSLTEVIRLGLIGTFWSSVLPASVAGDLVKMYYVGRAVPDRRAEAFTTVALDRVIGLAALAAMALVAALANLGVVLDPSHPRLRTAFYAMVLLLVIVATGSLALAMAARRGSALAGAVQRRLPYLEPIQRGGRALVRFGGRELTVVTTFALSLLSHALLVLIALISGRALGETALSPNTYYFLAPIGFFMNAVPLGAPGGAGVGESAFSFLFKLVSASQGAGIMLLYRMAFLPFVIAGGILYVADRQARAAIRGDAGARELSTDELKDASPAR